jgi:predicted alpha/beta superfamily hydrolase
MNVQVSGLVSSQLRKHEKFRSRFLRNQRDLTVYLPSVYDSEPRAHLPVLYLQDGQNLFDPRTSFLPGVYWGIGDTADRLIGSGAVQPLIIVGIYNAGRARVNEYTPIKAPKHGGGRAERYSKFLLQEVMPFIQRQYRVATDPALTGIGGSSLGGLVSLYIGLKAPHIFGRIAALSPSVWWNQRWLHRFAENTRVEPRPRIWLDIGSKEGARIVQDVEQFRDVLVTKGWRLNKDLRYLRVEGGEHNEAAWAQRVGPLLQFLYPPGEK